MMRRVVGLFGVSALLIGACGGTDQNATGAGGAGGKDTGGTPTGGNPTTGSSSSGVTNPTTGTGSDMSSSTGTSSSSSASTGSGGSSAGGPVTLSSKRYVAAGDQAYVIGAEDGTFPPMGWHIRGEMGGVWTHPIKLLDGYWFAIDGSWLPPAERYTTGLGYAQIDFPAVTDLKVTKTEFAVDGSPAVLIKLSIQNQKTTARSFALTMDVRSELMSAYPWGWTMPNAKTANGKDTGSFAASTLTFKETGKPWSALVKSDTAPASGTAGDAFWGPVAAAQQADYLENGNGTGGELKWSITLNASESKSLWIAVAGSATSEGDAQSAVNVALNNPEAQLAAKIASRQDVLAQTQVNLPDPDLQAAFDWGKLNMADLRRTVKKMQIRDVNEGKDSPTTPVITIPSVTGIGAGFPDYPWFFGTDGAYTSFPLVASGQWETAIEHLRGVRDVSVALNGTSGKVVHEIVTDGSVYFGDNNAPGDSNETAEFVSAVDLLWRWSGDNAFRDEMYDFVKAGASYLMTTIDKDKDFFPEGYGMVERSGMGSEKLDVTSYTWKAMLALQHMAESKGDTATATLAKQRADGIQAAFEKVWWNDASSRYADSLCNGDGDLISKDDQDKNMWTNVCTMAGQQLLQQHWIGATPMEVGLATPDHASAALKQFELLSGSCGLYHTGPNGGPDGKGELKCWTLPTSVMAVAEANYGRLGDDQALFYMKAIGKLINLEMPGALPEIADSPGYNPFPDFRERAMFMQAWSSYGIQWLVVHHILGVDPDVPNNTVSVVPHLPDSWFGLSANSIRVGAGEIGVSVKRQSNTYTTKVIGGQAGLKLVIGQTLPAFAKSLTVNLDGAMVQPTVSNTPRGTEVRVETTSGIDHTLVVTAN